MKFFRNNWYWILGIVIGLGIGSIITMHKVQQQATEAKQGTPEVAEQTDETIRRPIAAPRSTSRSAPNTDALRKRRLVRLKPVRPNLAPLNNPALKNIRPIHTGHDDIIEPPPPLPDDLDLRRRLMLQDLRVSGKLYEIRNGEKFKTQEAFQIELEALTGGMPPEEAIAFLEKHRHYNEAILSQVSADRAFKYLQAIRAHPKTVNEYAEKALAENPDNFEAKMKLMLSEKDNAKAAAGYREILAKDPNHVGALLNLGYRTHYDDPDGALEHLIKGNKLDPTRGLTSIGLVYERLGDVKTAWLYYRKHVALWGIDSLAGAHLSWIEAGTPKYTPIHLERQTVPQRDKASLEKGVVLPKEKQPTAVEETPRFPERSPQETPPSEKRQTDAEAARAAFQRLQHEAEQKEFDAFIRWAENIMREDAAIDTTDFLAEELRSHLKGGKAEVSPERIVRAFEMIERHGRTSGLQRLKDKDPELAAEVERRLEQKRQPPRRNNPPNKNE